MAKRKLTKTITESIIDAVARRMVDARIKPIETRLIAHLRYRYDEQVPAFAQAMANDPHACEYLDTVDCLDVDMPTEHSCKYYLINDAHAWFVVGKYSLRRLPLFGSFDKSAEELGIKLILRKHHRISWDDTFEALAKEVELVYQDISDSLHISSQFIASFTTVEGLLEASPELAEFIPKEAQIMHPIISLDVAQKAQSIFKALHQA